MTIPHPRYGSWQNTEPTIRFWRRRGLLAPFEREWKNGVCLHDPAIVPWERLSQRPEGWWRGLDEPHVWWCLCGGCGPGGNFEREEPKDPEEARRWFGWADSRQTLEEARQARTG